MASFMFLRNRHGKKRFIYGLPPAGKILDVGCGNDSPKKTKEIRQDINYIGLDVGDYNISAVSKEIAAEYVISTPEKFAETIEHFSENTFDGVISTHNLEHCNEPGRVLKAMCSVLRHGGLLFLSFPSEASVHFPSRKGSLNFYDDKTHINLLVWKDVLASLSAAGMEVVFSAQRYRPMVSFLIGLLFEPLCAWRKSLAPHGGTWALYGFESVVWARKV